MAPLSLTLATLFVLYVGIVRPILSRNRFQQFRKVVADNPGLRPHYYVRGVREQWLWLLVIGIILVLGSIPLSMIGLRAPDDWGYTLWSIAQIVVLLVIAMVVTIRFIAKIQRPGIAALLLDIKELLPHTAQERRIWLLLSATAGICEEIVFRGFLPIYFLMLSAYLGIHISFTAALVLSTILFGFAHIYQGWKGVIGTGLVGGVLAYLYLSTGSLLLPIVLHILIDARIVFLAPTLLKLDDQEKS